MSRHWGLFVPLLLEMLCSFGFIPISAYIGLLLIPNINIIYQSVSPMPFMYLLLTFKSILDPKVVFP